jgi:hypothetical protein
MILTGRETYFLAKELGLKNPENVYRIVIDSSIDDFVEVAVYYYLDDSDKLNLDKYYLCRKE